MYRENKDKSTIYRETYLNGIHHLIAQRQALCDAERARFVTPALMATHQEHYRISLKQLLGWPLTENTPVGQPVLLEHHVVDTEIASVRRVQIEVFDNFWYYGLLVVPVHCEKKLPLIICQHGGYGTPELVCDMHGDNHYDGIVWRLVARQAAVFLPQMLLWREVEDDQDCFPGYGLPYNRAKTDAQLKQTGSSITALEVYCLIRSLDSLQVYDFIDHEHFGMIGLSYGGFYTLMTSALDSRIRAGYASAFFNNRYRYSSPDFTWFGSASSFLDAEVAALIAPRALYLEVGKQDPVFSADTAITEFARLKPFYEAQGATDKLVLSVIDKGHRYDDNDTGLDFLMQYVCGS